MTTTTHDKPSHACTSKATNRTSWKYVHFRKKKPEKAKKAASANQVAKQTFHNIEENPEHKKKLAEQASLIKKQLEEMHSSTEEKTRMISELREEAKEHKRENERAKLGSRASAKGINCFVAYIIIYTYSWIVSIFAEFPPASAYDVDFLRGLVYISTPPPPMLIHLWTRGKRVTVKVTV